MSKLQRLRENIAAIECALKGEGDAQVLNKYTGFGGLGFVLNPIDDKKAWNKTDIVCYEDTVRLVELLREKAGSEKMAKKWMASLKASTLTAFYTPVDLVDNVMIPLFGMKRAADGGIASGSLRNKFKTMLDPAAGMGVFAKTFRWYAHSYGGECTCFEKDILTATMLKASLGGTPDGKPSGTVADGRAFVYCDGFEHFPDDELGCYDLVATNVPFGPIAVYDDAYSNSALEVRRDAAQMIHRYFVLKGLDALREGGLLAYIITSNYLNNDGEQVRYALQQSRLIGAYRLANNLFKENGTEVGTDLLVLQKDSKKQGLTEDEELLCTAQTVEGCPYNAYFVKHNDHLIATSAEVGTDAYGKPGLVFSHKDGVSGISQDVAKVLARDLAANFDTALFEVQGSGLKVQGATATPVTVVVEHTEEKVTQNPERGDNKKVTQKSQKSRKLFTEPHERVNIVKAQKAQKAPTWKHTREGDLQVIHGCYTMLYENEMKSQTEDSENRKNLSVLYDEFVKKYGYLHDQKNIGTVRRVANELLGLEVKDADGRWSKADIFFKPVAFATEEATGTVTAHEALCQSLNEYGKPDMQYIAGLTGMSADELIKELEGEVFFNPLNGEWEIKAKFLSGDVVSKADAIR